MSLDLTLDKSALVQVMAWCRQATSHYLSQCWPRYMSPYGVTRSQWVKALDAIAWQREFPVGFPVRVCASDLLLINIFLDIVSLIESRCVIKAKHVLLFCQLDRSFAVKTAEVLPQYFPRKIERINRPTRHVLLHAPAFCQARCLVKATCHKARHGNTRQRQFQLQFLPCIRNSLTVIHAVVDLFC